MSTCPTIVWIPSSLVCPWSSKLLIYVSNYSITVILFSLFRYFVHIVRWTGCRFNQTGTFGLGEAHEHYQGDCSRSSISSQILKIKDHSPWFKDEQYSTWQWHEPKNFRFWHGKNFWRQWHKSSNKTGCWYNVSYVLQHVPFLHGHFTYGFCFHNKARCSMFIDHIANYICDKVGTHFHK